MSQVGRSWPTAKLGDICSFKYGKALPAQSRTGGEVQVYGSNGVVGQHDQSLSHGPTIVIGRKGSFGEINYSNGSCWPIDTAYFVDRTATSQDIRWLSYRLAAMGLNGMNKSAAVPGLNREDAYRLALKIPPIPEQRRIAAILDQADALRAKRREALAQLDSLTQSIFIEMFGEPVSNPMRWPMKAFGRICETRLGKMLDQKQQTGEHSRPYLRNANVQWHRFDLNDLSEMDFDESARSVFRLRPGDLLICEGGEPGRAAIWNGEISECYYQKALHRARPDGSTAIAPYLAWLLWFLSKGGGLGDHVTAATIAHLTGEKLKAMDVMVPPLALQESFATRIQAVESLKATHYAALAELDSLFASLQHRAFSGSL